MLKRNISLPLERDVKRCKRESFWYPLGVWDNVKEYILSRDYVSSNYNKYKKLKKVRETHRIKREIPILINTYLTYTQCAILKEMDRVYDIFLKNHKFRDKYWVEKDIIEYRSFISYLKIINGEVNWVRSRYIKDVISAFLYNV